MFIKWAIIIGLDVLVFTLHALALSLAYKISKQQPDIIKLIPTTVSSAISSSIALTVALNHSIKVNSIRWEAQATLIDEPNRPTSWASHLIVRGTNSFEDQLQIVSLSVPKFSCIFQTGERSIGPGALIDLSYHIYSVGNPRNDFMLARQIATKRNLIV